MLIVDYAIEEVLKKLVNCMAMAYIFNYSIDAQKVHLIDEDVMHGIIKCGEKIIGTETNTKPKSV